MCADRLEVLADAGHGVETEGVREGFGGGADEAVALFAALGLDLGGYGGLALGDACVADASPDRLAA